MPFKLVNLTKDLFGYAWSSEVVTRQGKALVIVSMEALLGICPKK